MARIPETAYEQYLMSPHWRAKRKQRMDFCKQAHPPILPETIRCCGCGRFVWEGLIEIHHRTYENKGNERMIDLAVLCDGCHREEHGYTPPEWWYEAGKQNIQTVTKDFILRHKHSAQPASSVIKQCLQTALNRVDLVGKH